MPKSIDRIILKTDVLFMSSIKLLGHELIFYCNFEHHFNSIQVKTFFVDDCIVNNVRNKVSITSEINLNNIWGARVEVGSQLFYVFPPPLPSLSQRQ